MKPNRIISLFLVFLIITSFTSAFSYDEEDGDRLTVKNTYDHTGTRVRKIEFHKDGTNTTTYYVDDYVKVVLPDGTVEEMIYYRDSTGLVAKKNDSGMFYIHTDHLGSPQVVTDAEGEVVEETEHLPFGSVLTGGEERYGFTGKEQDSSGLMYYEARHYNPKTGIFVSPDPLLPDPYDPQQLNRYSYVRNNPVKYVDPTGNWAVVAVALGLLEVASDAWDVYSFAKEPSAENAFWLLTAILPGSIANKARYADEAAALADEAIEYSDEALEAAGDFFKRTDEASSARIADDGSQFGMIGNKINPIKQSNLPPRVSDQLNILEENYKEGKELIGSKRFDNTFTDTSKKGGPLPYNSDPDFYSEFRVFDNSGKDTGQRFYLSKEGDWYWNKNHHNEKTVKRIILE